MVQSYTGRNRAVFLPLAGKIKPGSVSKQGARRSLIKRPCHVDRAQRVERSPRFNTSVIACSLYYIPEFDSLIMISKVPLSRVDACAEKRGNQGDVQQICRKTDEHPSCRRHPDGEISPPAGGRLYTELMK